MEFDFHFFAEHINAMASIFSVEKFPDGSFGNICLVTGNSIFFQKTDDAIDQIGEQGLYKTDYSPNLPYEHYMPKDRNFEEFCYRSAICGETLHTYIHPERMPIWLCLTAFPLKSDKPNIGYCGFIHSFSKEPDYALMTNISPDVSSNVLQICMKMRGANDFASALGSVIEDIRALCNAEHCTILETDFSQRKCAVLCEAFSEKTELVTMTNYADDEFFSVIDTWNSTISGSTCAFIKDKQDWERLKENNPLWYNSLRSANIENVVLFPLRYRDETIGFIWATNFNADQALQIKEMLELATYFIASELASHQLFKRLETLSSKDVLTGILNRNAMNNRIDSIIAESAGSDTPVGIVFADLNGLKQVNDNQGHFAGDLLLKDAALTLQKHFPEYEIYRAGGDEFMVLAVNPDSVAFMHRMQTLKNATSSPDSVCFAVGWSMETLGTIRTALRNADQNMYADKEEFYRRHPERKR